MLFLCTGFIPFDSPVHIWAKTGIMSSTDGEQIEGLKTEGLSLANTLFVDVITFRQTATNDLWIQVINYIFGKNLTTIKLVFYLI